MFQNPGNDKIKELLLTAKTIAVVGISDDPSKPSFQVSEYMQSKGYEIIPVNPRLTSVLGKEAHKSLQEIQEPVDIVDVFRRSEGIPEVVDQVLAMKHKPKAVWIQLGIVNDEQCKRIEEAGIMAIQDACIKIEHHQLLT